MASGPTMVISQTALAFIYGEVAASDTDNDITTKNAPLHFIPGLEGCGIEANSWGQIGEKGRGQASYLPSIEVAPSAQLRNSLLRPPGVGRRTECC